MIINQTGVGTPFSFAGTGDELIVGGVLTNLTDTLSATVTAAQAGNIITNNGMIAGFGGMAAISLSLGGTVSNAGAISGAVVSGGALTLTNTGTLTGFVTALPGLAGPGSVITNRGSMTNAGQISATVIDLGLADDTVINSGKVLGDINLGEGNNTYDGRGGAILGSVFGGSGNDIYMISSALTIVDAGGIDTINARMTFTLATGFENLTLGGFGNFRGTGTTADNVLTGNTSNNVLDALGGADTLVGGGGSDVLLGGTGSDSLDGGTGNDRLDTGGGNDVALGGDGNDRLYGDSGADSLSGDAGNDTMLGGVGSDTMEGGDGDDVLTGGAFGADSMTGGDGADRFVFTGVDDSLATFAADVITDFTSGSDVIDLGGVVAGDLIFTGTIAFDGTAPSLRIRQTATDTLVQIDLDSDARADMQITLTGLLTLTAADFIL